MSSTARLAEGMDWTKVGEGASSAKANSWVLVPWPGCSSKYLKDVHNTSFCPSQAIDCTHAKILHAWGCCCALVCN